MESTFVIKVKYGNILRRFNARVVENNQLDINMVGLRTKILSLFNFPPGANFTLKYVDEDGDLVTLVDDDDLHEVMSQHLKFLRIDVNMSNGNGCKSNATSSQSSTCLRSPCVSNPILSYDVVVADVLKSVPEPVRALSNLSLDLASKAASSSAVMAALVDCISKIGQVMLTPDSQPRVAADLSSKDGGQEHPIATAATGTRSTSQEVETGNVTRDLAASIAVADLNSLPGDNNLSQSTTINTAPVSSPFPGGGGRKGKTPNNDSVNWKGDSCGASTNNATPGNGSTLTTTMASNSSLEFPFAGVHLVHPPSPSPGNLPIHPIKRSCRHTEVKRGISRMVIRCDGCGICPITGPRFKSTVKENYDLCRSCFNEMGNGTDYIRMDPPIYFPPRFLNVQCPHWTGSSTLPHSFRTAAMKHVRPKLDSQFILDVNVIEGTMMAPSTVFTKIWRMRNNGTIAWPKGAQLVWIGGDNFSDTNLVELQIPVEGVAVDQELDIAVDFKAPESPGRYISNWKMASPSGKRFGQRVWVLIQVDASLNESSSDSYQGLNLNVPPDYSGVKVSEIIDINLQPIMDAEDILLQPHNSNVSIDPVKQTVDEQSRRELENNFSVNDTTFVGHLIPDHSGVKVPESTDINSQPIMGDLFLQPHNSNASIEPVKPTVDEQSRQELENNFTVNDTVFVGHVVPDHSGMNVPEIRDFNSTSIMDDLFLQPHNSNASTEPVKQMVDEQSRQELENNFSMNDTAFVGHVVLDHSGVKVPEITDIDSQSIMDDPFLQPHNSNASTVHVKQTSNVSTEPVKQAVDEQSRKEIENNFSVNDTEITDINSQPIMDDLFLQPHNFSASAEPVKQTVNEKSRQELENNFSMNDTAFAGHVVLAPPTSGASPSVSCLVDLSKTVSVVPSYPQSSVVDEPLSSVGIDGKNPLEETLLIELDEMGFKEVDFNKEILRMNRYNLDLSLDYLCGVSEWDPILEELKEMAFHDNEINKKPLMKNKGSFKGLVMNLINGGKA